MGKPHNIAIGTKLKVKREKTTRWGWTLSSGETVEVLDIRTLPTRFEVKDRQGRTWILSTHEVEMEGVRPQGQTGGSA